MNNIFQFEEFCNVITYINVRFEATSYIVKRRMDLSLVTDSVFKRRSFDQ